MFLTEALKIIIGAGETRYPGWIATQENELDLLDVASWNRQFSASSIDALLAEYVFEHLDVEEGIRAAKNCFHFLKPGGYLRVAVPDRNFRNQAYQELVQIGGPGPADHPAASHKIVYNAEQLTAVFEAAGFVTHLLEYCDSDGDFHFHYWNPDDGLVGRSFRYDTRNSAEKLGMVSIILDAHKPLVIKP
nr:methyltransferase domain-containing protein [Listeria kieliensis]